MMIGHAVLVLGHIVLFVYWLGADLGVFYAARFVTDPALSVETRRTVMKIVHFIDLFPRMCLVLTVPIGISLALTGGYARVPDGWVGPALALVWVGALAWLMLVITLYGRAHAGLTRLDYAIRYSLILSLAAVAVASLLGAGPIETDAPWLAVKVLLFAVIISLGVAIRKLFIPFAQAYAALLRDGSSPAIEAAMLRAESRVRPVVLVLWGILLVEAFLGLSKL